MTPTIPSHSPYSTRATPNYAPNPNVASLPLPPNYNNGYSPAVAALSGVASSHVPWITPPIDAVSFDYQGLIALPAQDGLFHSIINVDRVSTGGVGIGWTIPDGYYCTIKNVTHSFIGGGFVQGSGSLIWQFQVDGVPVKGYGNVLVEFGSPGTPGGPMRPVQMLVITPKQNFQYLLKNVGQAVLAGTSVVATINGWMWSVGV